MKPWDPRPTGRKEQTRLRRKILILCEDTKSAVFYFEAFKIDKQRADIKTMGKGMNTDSLVEEAIKLKEVAEARKEPYHEIWCVFDRDEFPEKRFNRAFELAKTHKIRLAWSNEAFELWYLLHYNYLDAGLPRDQYKEKLKEWGGFDYDKADKTIYERLKRKQTTAFSHARRLRKHWEEQPCGLMPARCNPCTNVDLLVLILNELCELGPVGEE